MDLRTKTLPPVDDHNPSSRDHAKDGFSLGALENLVDSCNNQPNEWRWKADRAHAYYDMGKQLTPEREHKIRREWGIEPRQTNLVHGVINGILGQEAKTRTDVTIEADDDEFQDTCDVLSVRHKEATRESNCDMAVSNGYAGQVKGGIGWVEVSRAVDPLDYPYRVQEVDRRQIWYDWESTHLGLNNARWMVRKRWEDLDEAIAWMPEHEEVLRSAIGGWDLTMLTDDTDSTLYRSYMNERRTRITRDEWCDSARKRIKFFEVWYRVPAWVPVLHTGPNKRVLYDETNPLHVMALQRGIVKVTRAVTRQVRMALFAGPHRLLDVATTRRAFPYVPFFGFRDDETREPYGLIEGMISPQDEYNERRQMINWMLVARQLVMDKDALDDKSNNIADITRNMMRPDFVAILNQNRVNKGQGAFDLRNNLTMQREQVDVMQDAKALIQEVPRIYSTQLGNAPSGVTSGIAINSLTEQGTTAMGELNDNYRFARRMVHEQLLDLIIEDHLEEDLRVTIGAGDSKRVIVLNTWDPQTGAPVNRVKDAPIKVGMSEVPASPAFRMQEQQQIGQLIQALGANPAAVNVLAPVFIENSSVNNRKAIADDLRRATGQPVAGDKAQQQQAQQAQQQAQQAQQQAAMQALQADLAEKQSKVELNKTAAQLNQARANHLANDAAIKTIETQQMLAAPADAANDEDAVIDDALAEARQG